MASALPTPTPCPDGCTPVTVAVPGTAGAAGAAGTNGAAGQNAYTVLSAPFTMPAASASGTATVATNVWMAYGQVLAIGDPAMPGPYAYLRVGAKTGTTQVSLTNLEDVLGNYSDNVAAGTVFPVGTILSPGGVQGPAGVDGTSGAATSEPFVVWTATGTLSNDKNLGALTTGILYNTVVAGVATFSTATPDVDYTVPSAALLAVQDLVPAADRLPYFDGAATAALATFSSFGRTLVDDADAAAGRSTLVAAKSGANSDITSLTGLTTPLSVAQGGTAGTTVATARAALGLTAAHAGMVILQNIQPNGTNGGDFTSGAWRTRVLNTEVYDDLGVCTLAGNQFTLAEGEYYITAYCPAHRCNLHQARLLNVTSGSVPAGGYGTNSQAISTGDDVTASHIFCPVDVPAGGHTFRIEHQCQTTRATDGFGVACSFGSELYTTVVIFREV